MNPILVTGFDPFGGEQVNPASRCALKLDGRVIAGVKVAAIEVPTVFGKAPRVVEQAIRQLKPVAVIEVGQAGGAAGIRVERVAVNLEDARQPDNEGNCPVDRAVVPGGPVAYWATLPTRRIVEAIRKAGIPAFLSYSAGTFVCNHLFYATCHFIATSGMPPCPHVMVGFIHVPYLPEQVVDKPNVPSMSESEILRALQIAIEVAVTEMAL